MDEEKIGKFISKLRKDKNMTQEELADKLHIHRTLLNKIEKGKALLTTANLIAFSEFFNIQPTELLSGEKINKDNNINIQNISLKMYEENLKNKNKARKITILIFVLLILIFFIFFLSFFYSVKIYNIVPNDYVSQNSTIVNTNDLLYFNFNLNIDNQNIEKINLLYEHNGLKIPFYETNSHNFVIYEYKNKPKYLTNIKFNNILNNLYIGITFKDNRNIILKLNVIENYDNSNIFYKVYELLKSRSQTENKKSEIYELFLDIKDKLNEDKIIEYKNIKYNLKLKNDCLIITYEENNNAKTIEYMQYNYEYIDYYEDNKELFSYNIQNNKCLNGTCKNVSRKINLLKEILIKLKEN